MTSMRTDSTAQAEQGLGFLRSVGDKLRKPVVATTLAIGVLAAAGGGFLVYNFSSEASHDATSSLPGTPLPGNNLFGTAQESFTITPSSEVGDSVHVRFMCAGACVLKLSNISVDNTEYASGHYSDFIVKDPGDLPLKGTIAVENGSNFDIGVADGSIVGS
jgi:hypothetical protein